LRCCERDGLGNGRALQMATRAGARWGGAAHLIMVSSCSMRLCRRILSRKE